MLRKNVAIFLNTAWNIYNFRRPIIKRLKREGYRVTCFAPHDESIEILKKDNISVIPINNLSRKGTNPLKDIQLVKEIKRLLIVNKVDLLINYTIKPNIYGSIAANSVGIPSIAVVTGLGFTFLSNGLAAKAARRLYKYAFNRNNLTIFQNHDDQELFVNLGLVDRRKSKVILGSGIDLKHFPPTVFTKRYKNVLFIGRLLYDKGIRELIEGFSEFSKTNPNIKLNIVGGIDEDNPSSITQDYLSKNLGNGIHFLGRKDDVRDYIEKADVVILPSYREGLPRTMLEALAMSKPIITTDVPGCREVVVHEKNGFKITVKDSRAIKKALEKFYALSDQEIHNMGLFSRKLAEEKFSTTIVNNEMISIIKEIV